MPRLAFFPVLLVAACVLAAAYGAVHSVISFAADWYSFAMIEGQFSRFHIPMQHWNHAGAALVGALSTWWMGLVLGTPVLLVALVVPGWKAYVKHALLALGVAAGTALVIGLGTLAKTGSAWAMDDSRPIGGGVGLLAAVTYLITVRKRLWRWPTVGPVGIHTLMFFPPLLLIACVGAAAYGAAHNQLSYAIGPELFHSEQYSANLFDRYRTPDELRNRVGASLVGIQTGWWMGLFTGVPVLLVALIMPGWRAFVRHSLIAFGVAAGTTLVVGLVGLAASFIRYDRAHEYERARNLHEFSEAGGYIGILTAAAYLIVVRVRMAKRLDKPAT